MNEVVWCFCLNENSPVGCATETCEIRNLFEHVKCVPTSDLFVCLFCHCCISQDFWDQIAIGNSLFPMHCTVAKINSNHHHDKSQLIYELTICSADQY